MKNLNIEVTSTSALVILMWTDLWLRLVLQVWRLIPKQRNGSARLYKGTAIAVHLDQLLRFHIIRHIPGGIYTA